MKKIVLKQFSQKDGSYEVRLGNGTVHTYPSKRQLLHFLSQTNKFLTCQAFEVHGIYMALWEEFQRSWFYFGSSDRYRWTLHFQDHKKCREALTDCEDCIDIAIDRSHWDNGHLETFRRLRLSINYLKDVAKILIPLHKSRSQTAEIYRINSIFSRLIEIENKLNSYAQLEATKHITLTKLKAHG